MEVAILTCTANNQFHLGKRSLEDSYDIIHSDTLYAALVNVFKWAFPSDLDVLLKGFADNHIRISSAFHCLEYAEDAYLFFLPKPVCYQYVTGPEAKAIKGIRFVSLGIWKSPPQAKRLLDQTVTLGNHHLLSREELDMVGLNPIKGQMLAHEFFSDQKLVREVIYPKVRVHESSQTGGFYNQVNVQLQQLRARRKNDVPNAKLNKQTHFYFLLDIAPAHPLEQKMKTVIRLLADEGIGGERSTGCGTFESVIFKHAGNLGFPALDPSAPQCSLSLSIPKDEAEFGQVSAYQLGLRGGGSLGKYGQGLKHRKQVRMILEGALFDNGLEGKIVALHPKDAPIPVLRYGKAFSLPFHPPQSTDHGTS